MSQWHVKCEPPAGITTSSKHGLLHSAITAYWVVYKLYSPAHGAVTTGFNAFPNSIHPHQR